MPKLRTWGATAFLVAGFSIGMASGCDVTPPSTLDAELFLGPGADAKPGSCTNNAQCNDGNPCTTDTCVLKGNSGTCQFPVATGTACNDGNPCTVGDTCNSSAVCSGTAPTTPTSCASNQCQGTACAICVGTSCQPRFAQSAQYTVGSNPLSVAMGKFNGDAALDLVTANYLSHNVSVLLNNNDGTGTFGAATNIDVGAPNRPTSAATGDLNKDGKIDIAVTTEIDNRVRVLLNNGSGTFTVTQTIPVGGGPSWVAVGTLNGDVRNDLATANFNDDSVSVLLQDASGMFAVSQTINLLPGSHPNLVVMGDIDGIHGLDLVTANLDDDSISVLLNDGNGGFILSQTLILPAGSQPNSVAVEDFDANGYLDIVSANFGSDSVSVLLQNVNGTFQPVHNYSAGDGPASVVVTDINSDGKLDLAVANFNSNNVSVLIGTGNSDITFLAPQNYDADGASQPACVAAGDLDIDGRPDLATANFGDGANSVSVFINNTP